jgi:hypothetical protein
MCHRAVVRRLAFMLTFVVRIVAVASRRSSSGGD